MSLNWGAALQAFASALTAERPTAGAAIAASVSKGLTLGTVRSVIAELRAFPFEDLERVVHGKFGNKHDDFVLTEDLADAIAPFWPPAVYIKTAAEIADFVTTYGTPARPEDPAMSRATGPDNVSLGG